MYRFTVYVKYCMNCNDLFMGFFVVFIVFLGSLFIKNINIFLILDLLEYKNVW